MTALISLANLLAGVGLAARAPVDPARVEIIETLSGTALISGLALLGFGLRFVH